MTTCDMCGNDYDKSFSLVYGGAEYSFDSFECAISMVAPRCRHCESVIIGHGVETPEGIFCCAHCARGEAGIDATAIADRAR